MKITTCKSNIVGRQVERKCCPYYLAFSNVARDMAFCPFKKFRQTLFQGSALSFRVFKNLKNLRRDTTVAVSITGWLNQ